MMKTRIAVTAALTLALIGGGTSAAFADDIAPSEVASSADTSAPSTPAEPATNESPSSPAPTSPTSSPEPVTEPTATPSDTPVASPVPSSEPAAPEPETTTAPAPEPVVTAEPTPDPEPAPSYVTVLWQMPGAETTWPQKYVDQVEGYATWFDEEVSDVILCGTSYQQDVYLEGDVPALTADGILEDGEDHAVVLDYDTFTTADCIPPAPTATPTSTEERGHPDCTSNTTTVTLTTTTPTFVYNEAKHTWVEGEPTIDSSVTTVDATDTECPAVTPPKTTDKPTPVTIHTAVDRVSTPSTAAPVAGSLAYTGSNASKWLEWAALILAVGGGLFALGRPRREERD